MFTVPANERLLAANTYLSEDKNIHVKHVILIITAKFALQASEWHCFLIRGDIGTLLWLWVLRYMLP